MNIQQLLTWASRSYRWAVRVQRKHAHPEVNKTRFKLRMAPTGRSQIRHTTNSVSLVSCTLKKYLTILTVCLSGTILPKCCSSKHDLQDADLQSIWRHLQHSCPKAPTPPNDSLGLIICVFNMILGQFVQRLGTSKTMFWKIVLRYAQLNPNSYPLLFSFWPHSMACGS